MKNFSTLVLCLVAALSFNASAYEVLTSAQEILSNSIASAKEKSALEAVLNSDALEEEKTAALQEYEMKASPAPGYAFDLSFLFKYNTLTAENKGQYTQANLWSVWKNDVGATWNGTASTPASYILVSNESWMRVNAGSIFKTEDSYNKFVAYQEANLQAGSYELSVDAYVAGLANAANAAADDVVSTRKIGGSGTSDKTYTVDFKLAEAKEGVKLGLKRNDTAGNLTTVYFNNMHLYKLSNYVAMDADAAEGLAAAEGVDVIWRQSFEADKYYPICLPFIVSDWTKYFEEMYTYGSLIENGFNFGKVSSTATEDGPAKTQARKPYLVKFKENITEENYITFENVTVTSGNAGTWTGGNRGGYTQQGNWAAGTVPAGSYYLNQENNSWVKSDGTAPLSAFSSYIKPDEGTTNTPDVMQMYFNGTITTSAIEFAIDNTNAPVDVYNLQGMAVKRGVAASGALEGLPSGLYIVNGKKIVK